MSVSHVRNAGDGGGQRYCAGRRYFGTDGIRGRFGVPPITEDFFFDLGRAAAFLYQDSGRVLLGRDTRISSPALKAALEAGFCSTGLEVLDLGIAPTPMVACLAASMQAGGAVISASHNPYTDNGVKFFGASGRKLEEHEEQAVEEAVKDDLAAPVGGGRCGRVTGRARRLEDALERYLAHSRALFQELRLDGLHLVLDCAHGATFESAPRLFSALGAELRTLGTAPDGRNINAACGSMRPDALREQVRRTHAALGIAFDGDGDRMILVAASGTLLDGDDALHLLACHLRDRLNGALVGTVMSNLGLERAVRALGLDFHRVPVGDRHILDRLRRDRLKLGGESSGHIVHLDYAATGDGLLSALLVLNCLLGAGGAGLAGLLPVPCKCPRKMLNISWPMHLEPQSLPALKAAVRTAERRLEGTGRVLLRRSGTEALLRVLVEGEDAALVQALADEIAAAALRDRAATR